MIGWPPPETISVIGPPLTSISCSAHAVLESTGSGTATRRPSADTAGRASDAIDATASTRRLPSASITATSSPFPRFDTMTTDPFASGCGRRSSPRASVSRVFCSVARSSR